MIVTNIFDDLPTHMPKEVVQTLIQAADVRHRADRLARPRLARRLLV